MDITAPTDTDAARLLQRIGSFWVNDFVAQDQLLSLFRARAQFAAQEYLNFLEVLGCAVFTDIPVFHRELWSTLAMTKSELHASPLRYGEEGVNYGGGFIYGQTKSESIYLKLAGGLSDVQFIHDNPLTPTFTYTRGVDFEIADGCIYFYRDPFDEASVVALKDETGEEDQGIVLWLQNADYDRQHLISHLGASLKLYLPSSETSKSIMLALARLYTAFPSRAYLSLLLAAITDSPCCENDGEVVEHIIAYPKRMIITDKAVYLVPEEAKLRVAVGDVLRFGDMMTDAVIFHELAYGLPSAEDFPAVTCGNTLLVGPYSGELVFPNKQVDTWHEDGKIRFEITGKQSDIDLFWEHADLQGGLPYNDGQINPAETMLSCWKGHGIILKLVSQSFGPLAVPDIFTEFVRKVLSPRLVMLSYAEFALPVEHEVFPDSDDEISFIVYEKVEGADIIETTDGLIVAPQNDC